MIAIGVMFLWPINGGLEQVEVFLGSFLQEIPSQIVVNLFCSIWCFTLEAEACRLFRQEEGVDTGGMAE